MINRVERLHEILTEWKEGAGDITIVPLWSKPNQPARRVIVQAKVGSNGPMVLHPGIRLHDDDGADTDEAKAILRSGGALNLTI